MQSRGIILLWNTELLDRPYTMKRLQDLELLEIQIFIHFDLQLIFP